jgi:membrane protease YdiL (CAAX protease family)
LFLTWPLPLAAFGVFIVSHEITRMKLSWDLLLLLVALAAIVPWRGAQRVRALLSRPSLSSRERIGIYLSTLIAQWLAVALVAWRCSSRGIDAARLGLVIPSRATSFSLTVALAVLFAAIQLAGFRALAQVPDKKRGRVYEVTRRLMPQNSAEAFVFTTLVATVSICEEFLYRGFAFAVFAIMFGGTFPAVIASALLFGFGHAYQGRRGVSMTSILGLVFASARAYTGSLLPGVVAHFALDLLAGFAAPGGMWAPAEAAKNDIV